MTKKEAKTPTNEELILELSFMQASCHILKYQIKAAKIICEELQNRGVIEDAKQMHDKWVNGTDYRR